MHSPTTSHWTAVKRILRFLKGTIYYGMHFTQGRPLLSTFSDANSAGDSDDRRSTYGYGVFLGACLISWSTKKQATISHSSTESEYRSLAHTAAELSWIRMVLRDLSVYLKSPPLLYCDKISAISLASNPVFHARTKHIEVNYHFVREKVIQGDVQILFVGSVDQIADIFTEEFFSYTFVVYKPSSTSLKCRLAWGGMWTATVPMIRHFQMIQTQNQ